MGSELPELGPGTFHRQLQRNSIVLVGGPAFVPLPPLDLSGAALRGRYI